MGETLDKSAWRRVLRERRAAVSEEQRTAWGVRMVEHFVELPEVQHVLVRGAAARVMLYAATGPEAPTRPLAQRLLQDGVTVCLPRLSRARRGEMDVVPIRAWSELVSGPFFDIPQPDADAAAVPPETLDVVVVPGVGFDPQGRRLGQGGGYYDRMLATLPRRIVRIGWAFSVQVVEALPEEAHDQGVDLIVTEAGVVRPDGE